MNRLRQILARIVETVNARLDWMADRVQGRPAWDVCRACGRPARVLYLVPLPFGVERRCEPCREGWHQAIRDFYAQRAALEASIRHARQSREARKEAA
jgi:hypothetical protein